MAAGLSEEELQNLEELCHTADEYSRKSFVSWLREKYSAEQLIAVLYQLVQLPLFSDWPELDDYRIGLPEDFKRWGVRGVILREGIEGDAENVKSFLSVLVPRNPPNENDYFEVHALNFKVNENALQQAGEAARQILSVRGTLYLLLFFVITGDFLLISLFEAPLIFWHTRRLCRRMRNSDVGLIIDSVSGIDVAGSSLSLAACFAILMGATRFPSDVKPPRSLFFLSRTIKNFKSRLAGCAFTGNVVAGDVKRVERVEDKIIAMEKHDAVQQGVLPRENRKDGISANSISLFWCKSVSQVLRRLIPLRKTWGIINFCFLLIVALGPSFGQRLHNLFYDHQPPYLMGVESSQGFVNADAMLSGCKVRELDWIILYIGGDRDDGRTQVKVGARREEDRCLKTPEEPVDDWRSKLPLPVNRGRAVFDYWHSQTNPDDRETLTVAIIRPGKRERLFPLILIIR